MKYIIFLVSSIISLIISQQIFACGFMEGWSEEQANCIMFRANPPINRIMVSVDKNEYYWHWNAFNTKVVNDSNDRIRNCSEWKDALTKSNNNISIPDIYSIQYSADGVLFVSLYKKNGLNEIYSNNSFVKTLMKNENKELLEYMVFAKEMEITEVGTSSRFEDWEDDNYIDRSIYDDGRANVLKYKPKIYNAKKDLLIRAEKKLQTTNNAFLKKRYAFQVIRLIYQVAPEKKESIENIFKEYFGEVKKNDLMSAWAGMFYALSLSKENKERNTLLMQVWASCDDKKNKCQKAIDTTSIPNLPYSLQCISILMNGNSRPDKRLDDLINVNKINKKHPNIYSDDITYKYLPKCIADEIRAVEEWLQSSMFYKPAKTLMRDYDPFEYYANKNNKMKERSGKGIIISQVEWWKSEISELREENYRTDMNYLKKLKNFISAEMLPTSKGELRNFYHLCLGHISLLLEDTTEATKYLSLVNNTTDPLIQLQKQVDNIWLTINTWDICNDKFKNYYAQNIFDIDRINSDMFQEDRRAILYSLSLALAREYRSKGENVLSNLFMLKYSYYLDSCYYQGFTTTAFDWRKIHYFDCNATTAEVAEVVNLIEKNDRTTFENYLVKQLLDNVDLFKDLQGTMALRDNDVATAYKIFSSIDNSYWNNNFFMTCYLNEDPFKNITNDQLKNKSRKFDYKFSKVEFVKKILDLKNEITKNPSAEKYILLGNAYYNISTMGNSWAMIRFEASISAENYYQQINIMPQWIKDYITGDIAENYYKQAFKIAKTDDEKAYSALMLTVLHRNKFNLDNRVDWINYDSNSSLKKINDKEKLVAQYYGNEFMKYKNSKTYKIYSCPTLTDFLNNKLIVNNRNN